MATRTEMARGFESKAVAEQQAAAHPVPGRGDRSEPVPELSARKRRIELSRCDVLRRLDLAQAEPHREVLRRALAALDAELGSLSAPRLDERG